MSGRDRDRLSSSHDWDPDVVTQAGHTNGRVRELSDPDAYVMLGRLASAVARVEHQMKEASDEWKKDRHALRRERRRSALNVAAIVSGIQVLVEALRHAGVIK